MTMEARRRRRSRLPRSPRAPPAGAQAAAALISPTAFATPTATGAPAPAVSTPVAVNHTATSPVTVIASSFQAVVGPVAPNGSAQPLGSAVTSSPTGRTSLLLTGVPTTSVTTGLLGQSPVWPSMSSPIASEQPEAVAALDRELADAIMRTRHSMGMMVDSALDELAADVALWPQAVRDGAFTIPVLAPDSAPAVEAPTAPAVQLDSSGSAASLAERVTVLGMVAGLMGAARLHAARRRRTGSPSLARKPVESR